MGDVHHPRRGSMAYWPRKRARRHYPRVNIPLNNNTKVKGVKPLEFAGYKVGMTHAIVIDNRATSKTKGQNLSVPVTVIECPPLKVFGLRCYTSTEEGIKPAATIITKSDRELARFLCPPKRDTLASLQSLSLDNVSSIRLLVHTQPKLTSVGKKKPDVFEVTLPGSTPDQLSYAKSVIGKELAVSDIFKEGQRVDVHAVSKGKGFQGPVKRFGVSIRQHKAEKTKRGPGSLGAWCGQQHMMYRVAHAGQMGYHSRLDWNKQLLKIDTQTEKVNPAGGFLRYGFVKNQYVLLKGSVVGPSKRLVRFTIARRPNTRIPTEAPAIQHISIISRQR